MLPPLPASRWQWCIAITAAPTLITGLDCSSNYYKKQVRIFQNRSCTICSTNRPLTATGIAADCLTSTTSPVSRYPMLMTAGRCSSELRAQPLIYPTLCAARFILLWLLSVSVWRYWKKRMSLSSVLWVTEACLRLLL